MLIDGMVTYHTSKRWKLVETDDKIIVMATRYGPVYYIGYPIIMNLILAGIFSLGFKLPIYVYIWIEVITLMTLVFWFIGDKINISKGHWLIYDKNTNKIDLPREHQTFSKNKLKSLQIIIGSDDIKDRLNAEVNISYFNDNGDVIRYPLMRASSIFLVKQITTQISEKLGVPTYKITKNKISSY